MNPVRVLRSWRHRSSDKAVERVLKRREADKHLSDIRARADAQGLVPGGSDVLGGGGGW